MRIFFVLRLINSHPGVWRILKIFLGLISSHPRVWGFFILRLDQQLSRNLEIIFFWKNIRIFLGWVVFSFLDLGLESGPGSPYIHYSWLLLGNGR